MSIRTWLALPVAILCFSTLVHAGPVKPTPQALAVAQANNSLFVDLYKKVRNDGRNLCFSPYSVSTCLAMASRGAAGATAAEINSVRGFKDPGSDTDVGYLTLTAQIELTPDADKKMPAGPHVDLKIANSIWVQQDHPLLPAYVDKMREIHHAQLEPLDFADPGKAADGINQWVEAQTDGQIKGLIAPESVSPKSRIVLASALYFRADWLHPFAVANTKPADFATGSGVVKTPMMFNTLDLDYASDDKCQAVELPYAGDRTAMLLLFPAEVQAAKFNQFEENLSASYIEKIRSALQSRFVHVGLPQWKGSQSFDLVKPLHEMGMKQAFNSHADFSSLSTANGLRISSIAHAATIQVDEVGTTATAGTAAALELGEDESPPIEFVLNRPFVYLIIDKASGAILLGGRVMDPSKTG